MSDVASATFVYGGDGQRVKATFGTSTMVKYYYAAGQRVAMRVGSSTLYCLLTDHLGLHQPDDEQRRRGGG